jgi:hypothetical protein
MLTKSSQKVALDFYCACCDYRTVKTSNYNKHLMTAKHVLLTNLGKNGEKSSPQHICSGCNKKYMSRVGLWGHKKKCDKLENIIVGSDSGPDHEKSFDNTMIFELIRQNQEFKDLLIEQNKKIMELSSEPRIINNTNCNNTQNNHFNLQFFLNETCKDAITADQFVKDIQISFNDLENIGNQGYVQGFTDIIMKQLRTLDVTKRPLHCTDIKRETIYIKEAADTWNKDNDDKSKLKNVIEKVATKGRSKVGGWQRSHPDVVVLDSEDYDMNHKILRHTWGDGDTEKLKEKVIKNIVKEVHVHRN